MLKKGLEDRLAAADKSARASWPAVVADLNSLTETEVEQDGKRFLLRSTLAPQPPSRFPPSAPPCRPPYARSRPPALHKDSVL